MAPDRTTNDERLRRSLYNWPSTGSSPPPLLPSPPNGDPRVFAHQLFIPEARWCLGLTSLYMALLYRAAPQTTPHRSFLFPGFASFCFFSFHVLGSPPPAIRGARACVANVTAHAGGDGRDSYSFVAVALSGPRAGWARNGRWGRRLDVPPLGRGHSRKETGGAGAQGIPVTIRTPASEGSGRGFFAALPVRLVAMEAQNAKLPVLSFTDVHQIPAILSLSLPQSTEASPLVHPSGVRTEVRLLPTEEAAGRTCPYIHDSPGAASANKAALLSPHTSPIRLFFPLYLRVRVQILKQVASLEVLIGVYNGLQLVGRHHAFFFGPLDLNLVQVFEDPTKRLIQSDPMRSKLEANELHRTHIRTHTHTHTEKQRPKNKGWG